MKKLVLISLGLLALVACNRSSTPGTPNIYNTIAITDDGAGFQVSGPQSPLTANDQYASVTIALKSGYSNLSLLTGGPTNNFYLDANLSGPPNGTGIFTTRDTALVHFKELWSGGINYVVDSSSFDIYTATSANTAGIFTLWVHDSQQKKKVVNGTIAANSPIIK